jgi:hypothetical protein
MKIISTLALALCREKCFCCNKNEKTALGYPKAVFYKSCFSNLKARFIKIKQRRL